MRLLWTEERVRRFESVTEKLLASERLGWYRHSFAIRLLLPDSITTGSERLDGSIGEQLRILRASAAETLGRPLLAAFMPGFSVTAQWLTSLDNERLRTSAQALRELVLTAASNTSADSEIDARCTVGELTFPRGDGPTSIDALLAHLIPTGSFDRNVSQCLEIYRDTLLDAFGQTSADPDEVRLGRMSQPHHALDDALGRLAEHVHTIPHVAEE